MLTWGRPKLDTIRKRKSLKVLGKNEAVHQMLVKARAERRARLRDEAKVDAFLLRLGRIFSR